MALPQDPRSATWDFPTFFYDFRVIYSSQECICFVISQVTLCRRQNVLDELSEWWIISLSVVNWLSNATVTVLALAKQYWQNFGRLSIRPLQQTTPSQDVLIGQLFEHRVESSNQHGDKKCWLLWVGLHVSLSLASRSSWRNISIRNVVSKSLDSAAVVGVSE